MHRSYLRPSLIAVVLMLLAIIACVLPGRGVQPVSVGNPNTIETVVTGTARAAAQQTEQASLVTNTVSVVPTETFTPTPKISSAGTSLVNLSDGSTRFIDHLAGVQLVFPSSLLVFRVGEPEYYAAWEKQEMQNPKFGDIFSAMQNLDPKNLRVVALDVRPDHMPNEIITGTSIIFLPDDATSLEKWEKTRRTRHKPCVDYRFISSRYPQTTNGTKVLVVEESCSAEKGTLYERSVYFRLSAGTLHVDLETNFDTKDDTLLEFNQIVNSLVPITP